MTSMEMLKQVRLLLRRNFALHIRQPVILVLELLWPILIFLVVMAARNAIPPVAQPTCYYKAWALPSAGVVPFFQSMICNIDDCQNETEYKDIPAYPGSSVQKLVENTMPLISDKSIIELVSALPKGMRLVRVAVNALSGPDLSALLGDGFPIRNLLKDNNETRDLLLKQNLTTEDTDLLFNSSIQLPQILEILNEKSFCDFTQDNQLSNSSAFEKLRMSLCRTTEERRKSFFLQLKNHLNVKNIVQTMGMAMSELGRLDISEILKSIGGLLSSVQSSDIISSDIVSLLSSVLGQIRFENVDTEIISLLINDLEPLYRHSEWAGLINILKDIKLPKAESRSDRFQEEEFHGSTFEEWNLRSGKERVSEYSEVPNSPLSLNDSSRILETILELAGTGIDVVRLLPHRNTTQVQNVLKYFTFLVDAADEFTNSLKSDNSSKFIDNLADVLGAAFLNIAGSPEMSNDHYKPINWCDKKEAKHVLKLSERKNLESLQEYACRISRIADQDTRNIEDKERWKKAADKIRSMFSSDSLMQIRNNVLNWDEEFKPEVAESSRSGDLRKVEQDVSDVEDFITAAECSIQGFKEILGPVSSAVNSSKVTRDLGAQGVTSKGKKGHMEKLLLSYVLGTKNVINNLKHHFLKHTVKFTKEDTGNILEVVNKLLTEISDSNGVNDTSATMELLRFIPRLAAIIQNFNQSTVGFTGAPEFVSAFVHDLEPIVWKSITPEEVTIFSKKNESKHFCVAPETLDPSKEFPNSLACGQSGASFKILMPTGKRMKQVNPSLLSNYKATSTKFDTQAFSRLLLHLTSGSGFVFKVLMQFLKSIDGCESACSTSDRMLKKMCFLGRLQNIKNVLFQPVEPEDSDLPNRSNDILMQLRPLLGIDESVIEAYQHFMEVVESSAASNYSDSKDIVRLIVSAVRLVESFDDSEHKMRPVLHVTNSLISLLRNRVADAALYNTTSVVEIQNVFPGSPLTQDVVRSMLPVLPEIISTFFWTALAPGKLLHLVSESNRNISVIMSTLCNSSMTTYFYNPGLDRSVLENLGSIICRHKYYDVFEEIFQDPDIQEIVFEADNMDEVAWDDMMENIQDIISLLTYLAEVRKADLDVIPPLPKWQMMALDIYSQTKNPAVLLYIVNNKVFSDFCYKPSHNMSSDLQNFVSKNSQEALYKELCSMSKESFASKLVENLNQTVEESIRNSTVGPNAVGMAIIKEKFWAALLNIPEIKNIANMVFDIDVLDAMKYEKSDAQEMGKNKKKFSKSFVEKLMNATERAFDMADSMTDKRLSVILMTSFIPELIHDFASYVEDSDGIINISQLVEKGKGFEKLFQSILQEDIGKRRLESYVRILSMFFSKKKNANLLTNLCNNLRYTGDFKSSDFTVMAMCSINPKIWSVENLVERGSLNDAWRQIEKILDNTSLNKTTSMYLEKRKKEFMNSINKTLLSGIHVPDWSSLQKSSFYFSLMRSFVRNLNDGKFSKNNPDLYKQICVTKQTEIAFQESIHKLLDSIPDAEFMTCGLLRKNISSLYSWISKSADVKDTIEKVSREKNEKESCVQTWNWLLKSIDDIEILYNKLSKTLPQEAIMRVNHCLGNVTQSPLMHSLRAHANVLKQATKLLTGLAAPAGQWKEMREQISKRISQHLPVFLKVSDVMSNQTSWLLDFAGTDMRSLKESSINFNWLLRHGFSPSALTKRLCGGESFASIRNVFIYPPRTTLSTRSRTRNFLCSNGTIEEILETLNQKDIRERVLDKQEKDFFSGKWLQKLLSSSDVLAKILEHVGSSLKEVEIHNIYNVFQLFTKPQVLQNLAQSMSTLMQVLDPIFTGSSLIDTLQQVMDGLKAFGSLTQLANFNFIL